MKKIVTAERTWQDQFAEAQVECLILYSLASLPTKKTACFEIEKIIWKKFKCSPHNCFAYGKNEFGHKFVITWLRSKRNWDSPQRHRTNGSHYFYRHHPVICALCLLVIKSILEQSRYCKIGLLTHYFLRLDCYFLPRTKTILSSVVVLKLFCAIAHSRYSAYHHRPPPPPSPQYKMTRSSNKFISMNQVGPSSITSINKKN